ncbi:MAG TPA: hypothetical protein VGC42_05360 [Kofleriaceae bacterium]
MIREIGWPHAVPRLGRGERVSRAFDEMSREVHDCVLVLDEHRALAGIFTSRDFLNRIAAVRADPAAIVEAIDDDAIPRLVSRLSELSEPVAMYDLGGGA